MTILTDFLPLLALWAAWLKTPDGTNALFAAICAAALAGVPVKLCLVFTLLAHVALVLI